MVTSKAGGWRLAAGAAIALLAGALCGGETKEPGPYGDLSKMGAGFLGPGREETAPPPAEGVRIGLAGPERTEGGRDFRLAVEMAIEERNSRGGFRGKPFVLIARPDDGPWGMAAKQVAALAFDEEVWAILGGFDGSRAHIAELVAAKAWVPVVSPLASDLSIDFANVPWMFRAMQSDGAQAEALFAHAERSGRRRVAAFIEGARDSIIAGQRVREAAAKHSVSLLLSVQVDPLEPERDADRLDGVDADAVLVWGRGEMGLRLIRALRARGARLPAYAPDSLASPRALDAAPALGEVVIAAPFDLSRSSPSLDLFAERFRERSGRPAGPHAVRAHDAAGLVLEAIGRAGLSRARIRDEISKAVFPGLSGEIRFNGLGGNPAPPVLLRIVDRAWVRAEAPAPSMAAPPPSVRRP